LTLNRFEEAIEDFGEAAAIESDDHVASSKLRVGALLLRGISLRVSGRSNEAVNDF
jgi:hypothetical protein